MKHKLLILAMAVASLFLVSCKKDENEAKEPTLSVVSSELAIPGKGGEAVIEVKAEGSYSASVNKDWLTCTQSGSTITLSAGENSKLTSRYATLTIKDEEETIKLSVQQFGLKSSGFDPEDVTVKAEGGEFTFDYEFDDEIVATTDADWITIKTTKTQLVAEIAENTIQGTPENPSRTGEIKWVLGADSGVITVTQYNVSFMKVDSNWTVEYLGVMDYQGENVEAIQNTVADPSVSGKYVISYISKADLKDSGEEIGDYICDILAPEYIAEIEYLIALYAQYGYTFTFSDFLSEDTDYNMFDIFDPGDYYGVAFGFTDEGSLTGRYAYCEFTKEGGSDSGETGYSSWLGEWTDAAGSTWTISKKVEDESYTINGIEGISTLPVTAEYDSATKNLIVRAQVEIGTYESQSAGTLTMGYYGMSGDGYFYTPNDPSNAYAIFTATLASDGASASLAGSTISSNSGDVELVKGIYIGTSSEGKYYGISSKQVTMPSTITKVGGGDGGDDSGSGSSSYNKFLGGWTVTPPDTEYDPWTVTIKQKTADESFEAYNWQGWSDDFMSPAQADYSDGKIIFKGGTGTPAATGVLLEEGGEEFDIYYMSQCTIDGYDYVITSGTSMYDACSGSFDSNGNIVLTGLDVELSDGGTYTFKNYGIVAMDSATGGNENIYTFSNEAGEFPVTMKKAVSGSSKSIKGLSMKNAVKVKPQHVINIAQTNERLKEFKARDGYTIPVSLKKYIVKK